MLCKAKRLGPIVDQARLVSTLPTSTVLEVSTKHFNVAGRQKRRGVLKYGTVYSVVYIFQWQASRMRQIRLGSKSHEKIRLIAVLSMVCHLPKEQRERR